MTHLDNGKKDEFFNLGKLVFDADVKVGTLATAIEEQGIYTWDRYGRLNLNKSDSEQGQRALDLLATCYSGFSDPDHHWDWDWERFDDCGAGAFGWPASSVPDFELLARGVVQQTTSKKVGVEHPKEANSNLAIILGLLKFIKGEFADTPPHPLWANSEDQLALHIAKKMMSYSGVSQGNLTKKFTAAKQLIQKNELGS